MICPPADFIVQLPLTKIPSTPVPSIYQVPNKSPHRWARRVEIAPHVVRLTGASAALGAIA